MSHKRTLQEIGSLDDLTDLPRRKKQRVSNQNTCTKESTIFDVITVRDTILDYLSFSYENAPLFIHISDDNYIKKRSINLTKTEVTKIKQNFDNSSKDGSKYNFYYFLMFYANFKSLFGEKSLHMLLNTPVAKLTNFHAPDTFAPLTLNDPWSTTIMSIFFPSQTDSNGCKYLNNIEIYLGNSYNASHLFDTEQQSFLQKHHINFTNFNKIVFKTSRAFKYYSQPDIDFRYEILPSNTNEPCKYSAFSFEFQQLKSKPSIVAVPIWKCDEQITDFHTNSLLHSIERIYILRKNICVNTINNKRNPFILHLNHSNDFQLKQIFICGAQANDFDVNIKCYRNITTNTFNICNINNKCNISSNLFETYSLQLTDNEIEFIQKCKRDSKLNLRIELNDSDVNYEQNVFEEGLIHVLYQNDIYYFTITEQSELMLVGWTVTHFPAEWIHINTCDIPYHWTKLNVGGLFSAYNALTNANTHDNDQNIFVEMDGFSDNMKEFSINRKSILFIWSMNYKSIPNNMKFIRVPYLDYDYTIAENLKFLIDKTTNAKDLPYKKIEFKFHEMFFTDREIQYTDEETGEHYNSKEIDEYRLEKLLNPVFNTKYDGQNIVVYHRK